MALLGIITLVAMFCDTVTSAIKLWWTIPTYNYAFLILPISGYLVWRKREQLRFETPTGSLWGIAVTAAFALLWLISDITDINEGRHIAFIGMALGILIACLGWRISKILSFPLLYLWLLVPTGTVFLPLLQKIATLISSSMLQWFGIPIYVEGFFIEVPSGRYHIEEGCAGLNFILASLALAPLYAYLLYRSLWKQLLAVVIALVLAITMNGVRIAGIIALAHFGGPELNIVDNHLWYGWLFFTLVIFTAGYLGSYFADREPEPHASSEKRELPRAEPLPRPWRLAIAGALSLLAAACAFMFADGVNSLSAALSVTRPAPAVGVDGWEKVAWSADWAPTFANADLKSQQSYARNGDTVDLFIATYARQGPGQKMISYDNSLIDRAAWSTVGERQRSIEFGSKTLPLAEFVLGSGDQRRYVWFVYWVDGSFTADPLLAKLLEIRAKLFFGDQRAAIVAVSTPDPKGDAEVVLRSFLQEALPSIEALLKTSPGAPLQGS